MRRNLFLIYGVLGHLLFLATFVWLAAFVGDLGGIRSVDALPADSLGWAILVNLGLIVLFGLQHSVMARPAFKRVWTRFIPQPIERSTYVFAAAAATVLLMREWRSVDLVIWDVQHPVGRWLLYGLFAAGWLMVPAVSLMINHFDLFGTRQVWLYWRGREYAPLPFRTPWSYGWIRHPLYVGWMIAFWAIPTMTFDHFLLAAGMTGYMLLAVVFEERDLIEYFGKDYEAYRRRIPMFIPRWCPAEQSGGLARQEESPLRSTSG
ncbi:MAG: methanethiol S-methyltransferase [Planctomycetales bacterium]